MCFILNIMISSFRTSTIITVLCIFFCAVLRARSLTCCFLELMAKPNAQYIPNAPRYSSCEGIKFKIGYFDRDTEEKISSNFPLSLQRTQSLDTAEQMADGSCSVAIFDSLRAGSMIVQPEFDVVMVSDCRVRTSKRVSAIVIQF